MRISMKYGAAAVALAIYIAASVPASAAEPIAAANDWSGFYMGLHIGYGDDQADGFFNPSESPGVDINNDGGFLAGGQAGFNWQMDSFLLGIEGDVSLADLDNMRAADHSGPGSDILSIENEMLASIRGRIGMAFDQLMIYGTGGVAFNSAVASWPSDGQVYDIDAVGLVVGGGASWRVTQNVSLGGEVLKYFFNDTTLHPDFSSNPDSELEYNPLVVRATLNYHIPY